MPSAATILAQFVLNLMVPQHLLLLVLLVGSDPVHLITRNIALQSFV